MEIPKDTRTIIMTVLFFAFAGAIYLWKSLSGMTLILALIVFGALSLWSKEKHIKMMGLFFLVLLSMLNIAINGMNFGIDFKGGTRIPILLEHAVDESTKGQLVDAIKKRVSVLGLTEVRVKAIGNTQINVEIPSSDEERIRFIEEVLSRQGVYQGIIDGKIAITGDHIFSTSIRAQSANELSRSNADWGVSFSVDREGAEQFAAAAYRKGDYPVYMYLDRPTDAMLFYTREELRSAIPTYSSERECLLALRNALKLENGQDIEVFILDEINFANTTIAPKSNKTLAIISENTPREYKDALSHLGFTLKELPPEKIKPTFMETRTGEVIVEKIEGVGLLSAPLLSPNLAEGIPNYNFAISGSVEATDAATKAKESKARTEYIQSILKGGSLPVGITLGSRTTLPAALGEEFLKLSLTGIAAALVVISLLIGIRYMNVKATLPIVAISLAELLILLSILGSFTIDLAAMAGIIAAIGVGVDAQIVITDELLKKDQRTINEKTEHAFSIIKTNVVVAIISMIPLLFSGLVEIIGFATSTILGSLLGYLLSRPAYAVIVEKILGVKEQ
ncbi:MAG: hypothetical protein QXT45_00730 [Candidatus Bilamarchaeaceae archaeon]